MLPAALSLWLRAAAQISRNAIRAPTTRAVTSDRTTTIDADPPTVAPAPALPKAPASGDDHQCHYTRLAHETLNGTPRTLKHCAGCGERFWEDD